MPAKYQGALVGFGLSPETLLPGDTLTVTLVWRAEAEVSTSYHVFLHLTGPDGDLAAQSDGVPAGWTRPTTSWVAGEYVTDVHVLSLSADARAGDYTLSAGLYTPGGGRLADLQTRKARTWTPKEVIDQDDAVFEPAGTAP